MGRSPVIIALSQDTGLLCHLVPFSELIWALRAVSEGEVCLYPTMTKKLQSDYLQRVKAGSDQENYDTLTSRQREILKLIAEGHTNQEVAELLVLSITTVQTHRANIMAKLGLRRPVELVKYALQRGFITLDT